MPPLPPKMPMRDPAPSGRMERTGSSMPRCNPGGTSVRSVAGRACDIIGDASANSNVGSTTGSSVAMTTAPAVTVPMEVRTSHEPSSARLTSNTRHPVVTGRPASAR